MISNYGKYGAIDLTNLNALVEAGSAMLPAVGEAGARLVEAFKPSEYQALVQKIANLERALGNAKTSANRNAIQNQINALKNQLLAMEASRGQAANVAELTAQAELERAKADEASAKWKLFGVGGVSVAAVVFAVAALLYVRKKRGSK